jgi:hypothetical protein
MKSERGFPTRAAIAAGIAVLLLVGCGLFVAYVIQRTISGAEEVGAFVEQLDSIPQMGEVLDEARDDEALAAVRRLPGVALPDDADAVHYARQGSPRAYFWIRYTTAQFRPEQAAPCFDAPLTTPPDFAYDTDPQVIALLEWWTPPIERGAGGSCAAGGVMFNLAVDESGQGEKQVFLEIAPAR